MAVADLEIDWDALSVMASEVMMRTVTLVKVSGATRFPVGMEIRWTYKSLPEAQAVARAWAALKRDHPSEDRTWWEAALKRDHPSEDRTWWEVDRG